MFAIEFSVESCLWCIWRRDTSSIPLAKVGSCFSELNYTNQFNRKWTNVHTGKCDRGSANVLWHGGMSKRKSDRIYLVNKRRAWICECVWQPSEHDYAAIKWTFIGSWWEFSSGWKCENNTPKSNCTWMLVCVLMHFAKRVFVWSQTRETAVPLAMHFVVVILFFSNEASP